MGTAGWLAPELLRDDEVSAAADIWSLGAVLAYAATGRPPADGSRAEVVLRKVLDGDLDLRGLPPWLEGSRPSLPRPGPDPAPDRRRSCGRSWRPAGSAVAATAPLVATAAAPVEIAADDRGPAGRSGRRPRAPHAGMGSVGPAGRGARRRGPARSPRPAAARGHLRSRVAVMAAIGLKLWAETRDADLRLVVGPATVIAGGCAGGGRDVGPAHRPPLRRPRPGRSGRAVLLHRRGPRADPELSHRPLLGETAARTGSTFSGDTDVRRL